MDQSAQWLVYLDGNTFYLSNILIAGLLLTEYSYTLVLLLLLKYKIWVLPPPLLISPQLLQHAVPAAAVSGCTAPSGGHIQQRT